MAIPEEFAMRYGCIFGRDRCICYDKFDLFTAFKDVVYQRQ